MTFKQLDQHRPVDAQLNLRLNKWTKRKLRELPPGSCFEGAFLIFEDLYEFLKHDAQSAPSGIELCLCHGVCDQSVPPFQPMLHAWVELEASVIMADVADLRFSEWLDSTFQMFVIDWQRPDLLIPRPIYYAMGNVRHDDVIPVQRYSMKVAGLCMLDQETYGPWSVYPELEALLGPINLRKPEMAYPEKSRLLAMARARGLPVSAAFSPGKLREALGMEPKKPQRRIQDPCMGGTTRNGIRVIGQRKPPAIRPGSPLLGTSASSGKRDMGV